MTQFLQYVISGLSTGSIYALVALGLALIYRSTRILHFAHGDVTTAGTFFAFTLLGLNLHYWPAFILALVFGAALAMAFYFFVLVPAQRREATQLGQIILTVGLGLILQDLVSRFGGTEPQSFPFPLSDTKIYRLGGLVISQLSLGTFGIGLLGHDKYSAGTKLNAKTTAFAPLFNDMNNTMRNSNLILVQRLAPKFHDDSQSFDKSS